MILKAVAMEQLTCAGDATNWSCYTGLAMETDLPSDDIGPELKAFRLQKLRNLCTSGSVLTA